MTQPYIVADPWKIIENKYDSELHPITESLMSLGNGRMGQRANFEESYSGEQLRGNYIAGVYYPDKTRVGWWKNGYPEYFAKVLNAVSWINLKIFIDGEEIDLATATVTSFERSLDMKHGLLDRKVNITTSQGKKITLSSQRFYSIVDLDRCYMNYVISTNEDIAITIHSILDFNVRNSDANYDEDFWHLRRQGVLDNITWVSAMTKKTDFLVCAASQTNVSDAQNVAWKGTSTVTEGMTVEKFTGKIKAQSPLTLTKRVVITSNFYYDNKDVEKKAITKAASPDQDGYDRAAKKQGAAWKKRWEQCDIKIEGDVSAQQGIRFNIFQLFQTYSGEDSRLNIGPKGFTGEKYGGSTYWDTEAYCLPFYMATTDQSVARNLLIYRYNHLEKAIENAAKLGFKDGAALYPMVTINGEECHNEWEITFEEIHRNGAMVYAIYDYIRYTNDKDYLHKHGLEVMIAIARFWAQRVHLSPSTGQYVMMGVTGPNEYENNVDNNWYTNYLAKWCLRYTSDSIKTLQQNDSEKWQQLEERTKFDSGELRKWSEIIQNIYLPEDADKGIFIQHDGYLNKENLTVADLSPEDRPINQNWSWDRILRSPFIKQADVLQGIFFFQEDFSREQIKQNFMYYEPRTVHESSLSPCVHAILAAGLNLQDKAYEMYLRTARLDLDNYNNDTEDGCHITSMAGTWMSIVHGFAGMRIRDNILSFRPFVPANWKSFSFKINYRKALITVEIDQEKVVLKSTSDGNLTIGIMDKKYDVRPDIPVTHILKS